MNEIYKQSYKQDANIEIQQTIDDNSYGCNCSCNLITPKDIMESLTYIFKKIVDLFKCGSTSSSDNNTNIVSNTAKYLI